MSLADPLPTRTLGAAALGIGFSLALHLVGWTGVLAIPANAPEKPPDGIEGAFLISLEAPPETTAAAPAHDAPEGTVSADVQATAQMQPEKTQAARKADTPPLPTTPYKVEDPELALRVANPDQERTTEREAADVPTEQQKRQIRTQAPSRAARPPPTQGQRRNLAEAAARQEGLERERRRQVAEWQRRLALALDALKTYPTAARASHAEGRAVLHFTIDRTGRLIRSSLAESTGHPALDAAALDILKKAGRLPPPPAHLQGNRFSIAVPVTYRVR